MAEQTPWNSPYAYCSNDPVNRVDPTGMDDHLNNNNLGGVTVTGHNDHRQDDNDRDANNYANYWSNDHSNPNGGGPLMGDGSGNDSQSSSNYSYVPVNTDKILKDGEKGDGSTDMNTNTTVRNSKKFVYNKNVSAKVYTDTKIKHKLTNFTTITTDNFNHELSVSHGPYSQGDDGSVMVGNVGFNPNNGEIIINQSFSMPFSNTTYGVELHINANDALEDFLITVVEHPEVILEGVLETAY